jgi:hypothetical protein
VSYFAEFEIETDFGKFVISSGYEFQEHEKEYWAHAVPRNVTTTGIGSQRDADILTQIGTQLLERLKEVPPVYNFSLIGVEAMYARYMRELREAPEDLKLLKGCVIKKSLYVELGSPGEYVPFNNDYMWSKYEGEEYLNL